MPKVSVIIPVYKAEKYINRCIDSVLAQTFTDWECILVDDGSPDRSGEICDEYAKKDARIRVFHKENGGVSSARQFGMDHATGEYTIHADPDDWVETNMLEELYKAALQNGSDITMCNFFWDGPEGVSINNQSQESYNNDYLLEKIVEGSLHTSCCNKLIRRDAYFKYNVSFPAQFSLYEDKYVMCSFLLKNATVSYINKTFYHYVLGENGNSISQNIGQSIQYDKMMHATFLRLFDGTKYLEELNRYFANFIVFREFARHSLSNSTFKKECHSYIGYLNRNDKHFLFYYLGCCGFYSISYNILLTLQQLKRFIYRRK